VGKILKNFQAVIFDLDGLILDSERAGFVVWQKLCIEQGFELTLEMYKQGIGKGVETFAQMLVEIFGNSFSTDLALQRRPEVWREVINLGIAVKPGFRELLSYLKEQNIPRAIASSTERELVDLRLSTSGIDILDFNATVAGDEVENKKPAPDLYLKAAKALGVLPQDCLALEDSETGARAAVAAGMQVVVIPDLLEPTAKVLEISLDIKNNLTEALSLLTSDSGL
jgi:HAD superfamily hydrolase (TIGR01509 family)